MNKKRGIIYTLSLLIILLIMCSSSVLAIGLSPAKAIINYEGPFESNITYNIRSNSRYNIVAGVNITGELSKYIKIDKDEVPLKPGSSGSFRLNINVPENHGLAGKQIAWVKVYEKQVDRGVESTIMVTTSASAAIVVYFPYPGKFIDITNLKVDNVNEGEDSNLVWEITSRGEQDVVYSVVIDIIDLNNNTVISKEYAKTTLRAGDVYETKEKLSTNNLKAGRYKTHLILKYEDKVKTSDAYFNIGEEDVELVDYNPKNLTYGEINKMRFSVKGLWNDKFDSVYAHVKIDSVESTTPTLSLDAFKTINLEQYVDVSGLNETEYNGSVEIFFDENSKTYPITVNVVKPIVELPKEVKSGISLLSIYFILLALILIGLVVFVLIKKRKSYP